MSRLPDFPAVPPQRQPIAGKKTLAGVIGSAAAAAVLLVMVPQNESGGKVYLNAYLDIARIATICDGITHREDGTPVRLGDKETEQGCKRRLEAQIIAHAEPIIRCVPQLKGRTNQVIAAVDLSYNIGAVGFCKSSIAAEFRAGNWRQGCERFLVFNKARVNGVLRPVRGLTTRRQQERALCVSGLS